MMILQFENGDVYRLSDVLPTGESGLLCGLAQEYTPLGRFFVESIWYNKPVTLIDTGKNQKAAAKVWRCHITGSVFADFLNKRKTQEADADFSAVWELRCGAWEPMKTNEAADRLSQAKEPETGSIVEYHLDHSYYKK